MALYTFSETTYVILYTDDRSKIRYYVMEDGMEMNVPDRYNYESYTDEATARARAIELGYVFNAFDPDADDD